MVKKKISIPLLHEFDSYKDLSDPNQIGNKIYLDELIDFAQAFIVACDIGKSTLLKFLVKKARQNGAEAHVIDVGDGAGTGIELQNYVKKFTGLKSLSSGKLILCFGELYKASSSKFVFDLNEFVFKHPKLSIFIVGDFDFFSDHDQYHEFGDFIWVDVLTKLGVGMRVGSTGYGVQRAQGLLKDAGYALISDGDFGRNMKGVVQQFQRDKSLTADGVIGPQTFKVLQKYQDVVSPQEKRSGERITKNIKSVKRVGSRQNVKLTELAQKKNKGSDRNYWWINTENWIEQKTARSSSKIKVYAVKDSSGKSRKHRKYFKQIKKGDVFVVCSTQSAHGIYALGEITEGLHLMGNGSQVISLKLSHIFDRSVKRAWLGQFEEYKNSEAFEMKSEGLFKISETLVGIVFGIRNSRLSLIDEQLKADYESKFSNLGIFTLSGHVKPGLEVEKLADQMALILNGLEDAEAGKMIGLFGKWGRGKTYLMHFIWNSLIENDNRYIRVNFLPWKYQDTPASWAYLYESFSKEYYNVAGKNWPNKKRSILAKSIKLDIARNGYGFLVLFVLSLILFLFISYSLLYGHHLQGGIEFSIGGVLISAGSIIAYLRSLYINTKVEARNIFRRFLGRKSFENVLGVQAEVEKELRILLKAWLPSQGKDRILLFVDDIDRCQEKRIIEIIDSLRVLLEDNSILSKVVVLAAVDDTVLKRAIKWKYHEMIDKDHSLIDFDKKTEIAEKKLISENLTNEYMDKLFLAGVKLGVLTESNRLDILEKFKQLEEAEPSIEVVNVFNRADQEVSTESLVVEEEIEKIVEITKKAENIPASNNGDQVIEKNSNQVKERSVLITEPELKQLKSLISQYVNATPRQIRIFYFRYVLGRNLLFEAIEGTTVDKETSMNLFRNLLITLSKSGVTPSQLKTEILNEKPDKKILELMSVFDGHEKLIITKVIDVLEIVKAY